MTTTETGVSSYTHVVCGRCGVLLYCSEAEPWEPQQEFGWCPHDADDPEATGTSWPGPTDLHNCNGEMRTMAGGRGTNDNVAE